MMNNPLIITIEDKQGRTVLTKTLDQFPVTLGRSSSCDISLSGWHLQPEHIQVNQLQKGQLLLIPKSGAKYKTAIGKNSSPSEIASSDWFGIGLYKIKFSDIETTEPEPSSNGFDILTLDDAQQTVENKIRLTSLHNKWQKELHNQLFEALDLRRINIEKMGDEELHDLASNHLNNIVNANEIPTTINIKQLKLDVLNEALALGPLEELLARDDISEIMVNGPDHIFYECNGRIQSSGIVFSDQQALMSVIERIVSPLGRRIDESSPMVDARLKDGSRVNAIIPPLALNGPCLTIRKFSATQLVMADMVASESLNQAMACFLKNLVLYKQNILISGGTGSGKTTLLNLLSSHIPDDERLVVIEDAAELQLSQPNLVSLEARPANQEGQGQVSIRDLVKNSLRMRPDRIVVGECRGGEALDMLQAMNTGHDGSLTTAHANTPRDCLARLEVMVLMAGMDLPTRAIREQISAAINFVIQQTRFSCGARKITAISEVGGIENGTLQITDIFRFKQQGYDDQGKVMGFFEATGVVPEIIQTLREKGIEMDINMFSQPETS